ncbi:MAG: diiron oxygenase [Acidobacteriaceae bacterium]|jgi:hypothetical protein|nr:diiron oxygenase [Acidobacteriaceae bacterium]
MHYESKFMDWHTKAWVKKPEKQYFPARLFPAADHPLVLARGEQVRRALLVKRLYGYASFTALLESDLVNPVTLLIAAGRLPVAFPAAMRQDADLILIDETTHAAESNKLIAEVELLTGVRSTPFTPEPMAKYARLIDAQTPELRGLCQLACGIVSETLISSTLSGIPSDPATKAMVQEYAREHGRDEARHHAFFSQVLQHSWPQLTAAQKETVSLVAPRFMTAFLSPDVPSISNDLLSLGFTAEQTAQIVAEKVTTPETMAGIRTSVQKSIGYFAALGALELPGVREAFEDEGLL